MNPLMNSANGAGLQPPAGAALPTGLPAGMNPAAQDPLAQLRGLHLPAGIESGLPLPTLIAIIVIAVALVAFIAWRLRERHRSLAATALRELDALSRRELALQPLATELSELLRRVARSRFGAPAIASLHGRDWSGFLARRAGSGDETTPQLFALIAAAPYQPAEGQSFGRGTGADSESLVRATRGWIRRNA